MIALDVGYGQLDQRLRDDPRVTVLERTNARSLDRAAVPAGARHLRRLLHQRPRSRCRPCSRSRAPGWQALVLVKPQFEAGRADVGKGGVVRDRDVRRRVVREVAEAALALGRRAARRRRLRPARPEGQPRVFLHLVQTDEPRLPDDFDDRIDAADQLTPSAARPWSSTASRERLGDAESTALRASPRTRPASSWSTERSRGGRRPRRRARRRRHDAARAQPSTSAPASR